MKKHSILSVLVIALFTFNAISISKVENPILIEQVYAADDPYVWCYKLEPGGTLSGYDYKWGSSFFINTCEWKTNQLLEDENWQLKCFIFAPPPAP